MRRSLLSLLNWYVSRNWIAMRKWRRMIILVNWDLLNLFRHFSFLLDYISVAERLTDDQEVLGSCRRSDTNFCCVFEVYRKATSPWVLLPSRGDNECRISETYRKLGIYLPGIWNLRSIKKSGLSFHRQENIKFRPATSFSRQLQSINENFNLLRPICPHNIWQVIYYFQENIASLLEIQFCQFYTRKRQTNAP